MSILGAAGFSVLTVIVGGATATTIRNQLGSNVNFGDGIYLSRSGGSVDLQVLNSGSGIYGNRDGIRVFADDITILSEGDVVAGSGNGMLGFAFNGDSDITANNVTSYGGMLSEGPPVLAVSLSRLMESLMVF